MKVSPDIIFLNANNGEGMDALKLPSNSNDINL